VLKCARTAAAVKGAAAGAAASAQAAGAAAAVDAEIIFNRQSILCLSSTWTISGTVREMGLSWPRGNTSANLLYNRFMK
jgi:hypothetical protein